MVNFPAWDMHYVHPFYRYTTVATMIGALVTLLFAPRAVYLYFTMKRFQREYANGKSISSSNSLSTNFGLAYDEEHSLLHHEGEDDVEEIHKRVLFTHGINVRNDLVITCVAVRIFQALLMVSFAMVTIWGDLYCCPNDTGVCPPPQRGESGLSAKHCDRFAPLACPVVLPLVAHSAYPWFGNRTRQTDFCDLCKLCPFDASAFNVACPSLDASLTPFDMTLEEAVNKTCSQCYGPQHIYALTPDECRISALGDQYLFAAAYTATCLFLATLNFGNLSKRSCFFAIQFVACATTLLMWGFTPRGAVSGVKFARTLPWCWIPDANSRPGEYLRLTLLQVTCEFVTIPICLVLGVRALRRMTAFYRKYPQQRNAVDRRLVPQVVLIVCELGIALITRIAVSAESTGDADLVMLIIDSFLYPATGGITALIWAYGEGIFKTLVNPTRSLRTERLSLLPFSVIGNYYRSQQSTSHFFERQQPRSGGTSLQPSPQTSRGHFLADE